MTKFRITKDQLDEMQIDAGVLCRNFDVDNPALEEQDVICATSGGISIDIMPSYEDTGKDVYMMEPDTAEMLMLTGWTVGIDFTSISTGAAFIAFALGAAEHADSITPRTELEDSDFSDLWWIGDRADGGLVAVRLINALSDGGFSLQTGSNAKGGISLHLTAHGSLEGDSEAVPVEIYSIEGRPFFNVVQHQWLWAYNISEGDLFRVDESTGQLVVTEAGGYTYDLDEQTGRMEVTQA